MASIGGPADADAVTTYNGIYGQQSTLVNDKNWFKLSRRSWPHESTIYWSADKERWIIEAADVIWEAPNDAFNLSDDDQHFPGLQTYFGGSSCKTFEGEHVAPCIQYDADADSCGNQDDGSGNTCVYTAPPLWHQTEGSSTCKTFEGEHVAPCIQYDADPTNCEIEDDGSGNTCVYQRFSKGFPNIKK